MAEDTLVVKEQLTDTMIEAGAQLTQKLDEMGLPIAVAMWFFEAEINEWRLLFASPQLSVSGPRPIYEQIQLARKALGSQGDRIPFSMIGLLDINNQLVRLLRSTMRVGPTISRVRFSKNVINGTYVEDALIYRSAA